MIVKQRLFPILTMVATLIVPTLSAPAQAPPAEPAHVENLWPELAGKSMGEVVEGKNDGTTRITNIENPSIAVYPAAKTTTPSPAVLVCPGGGYKLLAYDKEGTEIAQWLNSIGFTAVVLKYRVPDNRAGALDDAKRSLRLMRQHAGAWNIDPERIGILGFSAGGHLAACASAGSATPQYPPVDEADALSDVPNFTVLVYPAYLSDEHYALPPEIDVTAKSPRAFVVQTQDDRAYINSSLAYYMALKAAEVPAELHLFPEGGHGYGLRPSKDAVSGWPALCGEWLRQFQPSSSG